MQADISLYQRKILIVDDDTDLLELLQDFLQGQGFEVKAIKTSTDIFDIISQFQPHLIILDYLLAGVNGGELCHQVKTTTDIPVILYSAYSRVLLSLGTYNCDQFISKPFDLDFLLDSARRLLATKQDLINSGVTSQIKTQSFH